MALNDILVIKRNSGGNWQEVVIDTAANKLLGTDGAGNPVLLSTLPFSIGVAWGDITGKPSFGGAALLNVGTTAGTVAAGDDSRFASQDLLSVLNTGADASAFSGTVTLGAGGLNTTGTLTVGSGHTLSADGLFNFGGVLDYSGTSIVFFTGAVAIGTVGNVDSQLLRVGSGAISIGDGSGAAAFINANGSAMFADGLFSVDTAGNIVAPTFSGVAQLANAANTSSVQSFFAGADFSGCTWNGDQIAAAGAAYATAGPQVNEFFQSAADFTGCTWNGNIVPVANAAPDGNISAFFNFAPDFSGCTWNGDIVPTAINAGTATSAEAPEVVDFFLGAPTFSGCTWDGNLVPGAMTADTGWTANADAGTKTVVIGSTASLGTIATALDIVTSGAGTQLKNIGEKVKALEDRLKSFLLPNA